MNTPIRFGELSPGHRGRVEAILRATGAFSDEEVRVGLELLDEATARGTERARATDTLREGGGRAPSSHQLAASDPFPLPAPPNAYSFLGAFTPEDELAGYACYGPTPGTDRTYDLYWIAVHPAVQGAGIGTILLREVERRLEGHRARMLVVETSSRSDYARTRAFYERCGYAERARVRDFYAPGDDRIILIKRFQNSPARAGSAVT